MKCSQVFVSTACHRKTQVRYDSVDHRSCDEM